MTAQQLMTSVRRWALWRESCYQLLANWLRELDVVLILKGLVSAVGIEPTTY
jgi:hypothetical protein